MKPQSTKKTDMEPDMPTVRPIRTQDIRREGISGAGRI